MSENTTGDIGNFIDVDVMQDASEVVHYDRAGVPLYIRAGKLLYYPDMRAQCHWHEDFELIYITKGVMRYYINGKTILLEEGDSLIVNSRQMHYGYSDRHRDCDFLCILFHPGIFSGNMVLYKEIVQTVIEQSDMEFLRIRRGDAAGPQMEKILNGIYAMKEKNEPFYEWKAVSLLYEMWGLLLDVYHLLETRRDEQKDENLSLQRVMMDYIYQHYQEKITLDDIAESAHVGRSKCCALFRQYLQDSPVDFLNQYRLKVCCDLLAKTDRSVTDIAMDCGFNHLSYFSRQFVRYVGLTPRQYRTEMAGRFKNLGKREENPDADGEHYRAGI